MHTKRSALLLGIAMSHFACGYRDIEPPRAPAMEILAAPARTSPVKPGQIRVVLDANGDRAAVIEILETADTNAAATSTHDMAFASAHTEIRRPVCMTPCVADFEAGMHELSFESRDDLERKSVAEVQIDERTKAIRHAMGRTEESSFVQTASVWVTTFGAGLLLIGGALIGAAATGDEYEDKSRLRRAGIITTAASGVSLAFSIPTLFLTRPIRQKGSTTQISE